VASDCCFATVISDQWKKKKGFGSPASGVGKEKSRKDMKQ